jgi:hypothetical protein
MAVIVGIGTDTPRLINGPVTVIVFPITADFISSGKDAGVVVVAITRHVADLDTVTISIPLNGRDTADAVVIQAVADLGCSRIDRGIIVVAVTGTDRFAVAVSMSPSASTSVGD